MTDISSNNKRIAKNTLLLYFRMIILMLVTLYTSRVVLDVLGVEDYGIYNVVGGVVAMFGFINGSMATSTQRYLTFELGRGNHEQLTKVFSTSLLIHGAISLLVVLLAETIGLWFFYEKMTIPPERIDTAFWVYQFAILSTVVMFMSVPYNACIIAHEKMSAFAYISVLEAFLKLAIVFVLTLGDVDKLKLYAVLMFVVQLSIRMVYSTYCSRHFPESKFRKVKDIPLFKEMLSFAGWNLWGSCAVMFYTQGLNILLNMFFTPIVNAARGVAVQVQGAVMQFTTNFQTAMNPQITKSYATGDLAYMHNLIFRSSKFTFFLVFALSLPIFMEIETLLKIWLVEVPEHTGMFIRLMLCVSIIDSVANPFMVSAQATGHIKTYQAIVGGIQILIVPIAYIVLKLGGEPESVFVVHICMCMAAFIARMLIIRPMIHLHLSRYLLQVIWPCVRVCPLACILPLIIKSVFSSSPWLALVNCLLAFLSVALTSFLFGLTCHEREVAKNKMRQLFRKLKR